MKVVVTSIIFWNVGHFAVNWKPESDSCERKLIPGKKK